MKNRDRVMAPITSTSLSSPAARRDGQPKPFAELSFAELSFAEFKAFWQHFFARAFNPYRPELHYMRGPGPAWRAKQAPRD
jgi:hypothetical protein